MAHQTHAAAEILVVDDGSVDDTRDVVHQAAQSDARITYIYQSNAGAPAARNTGIRRSTGTHIAFQDSDDEWDPSFIERLLRLHTEPRVVAFSSMTTIQVDGQRRIDFPQRIENVKSLLRRTNCISTQCALLDSSLLSVTRFDERLPRLQDWDLWLTLLDDAVFKHDPTPLVTQYIQEDSITRGRSSLAAALTIITRKHARKMARHPLRLARLRLSAFRHAARDA